MPPKKKYTMHHQYFDLTKTYSEKYGEKTILLMQCGAFYEVYAVKTGDAYTLSRIEEYCQITNLNIAQKHVEFDGGIIVMAGFRDYCLEKYLEKICDAGYTAVVYVQSATAEDTVLREFQAVYSPSTFVPYENDQLSNTITCIWVDVVGRQPNEKLAIGLATCNAITGETAIFEYVTPNYALTAFDELYTYLLTANSSEIIVISLSDVEIGPILDMTGAARNVHVFQKTSVPAAYKDSVDNAQKQIFVDYFLGRIFGADKYGACAEFRMWPVATQALCFLLNFVQEQNPMLVDRIQIPEMNHGSRVLLANHTLKQLNIVDDLTADGKAAGRLSSVYAFLNKCCTAMGKRAHQHELVHPIYDAAKLAESYKQIEAHVNDPKYVETMRSSLRRVCDLEKAGRQMVLQKIYPSAMCGVAASLDVADLILQEIGPTSGAPPFGGTPPSAKAMSAFIRERLQLDLCQQINRTYGIETNFIVHGFYPELDEVYDSYVKSQTTFRQVYEYMNRLMRQSEKKDAEYVSIHETEKSGCTLQITQKRATVLQKLLDKAAIAIDGDRVVQFSTDFAVPLRDIRFIKAGAAKDEIEFPQFTRIIRKIQETKERLSVAIMRAFSQFLREFVAAFYDDLRAVAAAIGRIDVIMCKTFIAQKYAYCKPELVASDKSFFEVEGLRHVLIEQLQTSEIYVSNNLTLSGGMLLFGTNAVGKTSLIRAMGIALILAQSGHYVPCSKMVFCPYKSVFSRILGNDNLFRGMSTFAVEMSELRVILKMATPHSLVLGDELCSGTETESALSIFTAGIMQLCERGTTFMFATHFHEITHYAEIEALTGAGKLRLNHMAVHYDGERLVYDRKLRDGAGSRVYGLEVCKSLAMDTDFLYLAYELRNRYFPDLKGELSGCIKDSYNARKVRSMKCEKCGVVLSSETHHIVPQKMAATNGYVEKDGNRFHKNHPANLMGLCEKCHLLEHIA
jgi:DNA mismatch repair protein MutS